MRLASVLLAILFGLAVTPNGAVSVAAAPAETKKAFAEIAGCISGADNVLVSVVVDESLSLRETDPMALRVKGITSAVDSLEQLAQTTPEVNVEVSLATFARSFSTLVDWQTLDQRSAEQLRAKAVAKLPKRDAGNATDYRQALLGAKKALETRARQLKDNTACKVLLWFTDGALDVDADTATAAAQICQPGGIADAVRHAGINVVALALFTPGARVPATQRDQLRAVAEGKGQATSCGTLPLGSDDAHGVYLPADNPAALQLLFAGAGALVAGGTSAGAITCPGNACPGGRYKLNIDPGTAGVRVIVQGSGRLELRAPDGKRVTVSDGLSRDISGAHLDALQRDSLTTINLTFPTFDRRPQAWTLTPDGNAAIETYWFWGAEVAAATRSVMAGQDDVVQFQLQDASGVAIPATLYDEMQVSVKADGQSLPASISDRGRILAEFPLDTEIVRSAVVFTVEITARTRPSRVALGPIRSLTRIKVELPPAFPTVTPKSVDFGTVEGVGSRDAQLQIAGSDLGQTKVCLADSPFVVPGSGARVVASAVSSCVTVPRGGERAMTLTLAPGVSADGVAEGAIELDVTSSAGEQVRLSIPASLDMARKVDEGQRWMLVVALIMLALLIPALLLIGSNVLLLGKFAMSSGTRIASVPIRIRPDGLSRLDSGDLVDPDDLRNAPFSGTKRASRMDVSGTSLVLRATRRFSLRAPRGLAHASGARKIVSGFGTKEGPHPVEAPVGLGSVDAAFVIIDNLTGEHEATGRLVVVIPPGVDVAGANERSRVVNREVDWQRILDELAVAPTSAADATAPPEMDRSEGAAGVPASAADDGPSGASSGAPDLPSWLTDESPATAPAGPAEPSKRRRPKGTQQPPQVPHRTDDLPPLPDFLRDRD